MGKMQKLDNRVQVMLQNGAIENYRTVLVIVGNKGQDQVPILYKIQTATSKKGMLKILWCYKKDLSFSTHRKRNLKLLNKRRKAGVISEGTVFEQFICSSDITWCYYSETNRILGQTFDMCILQDFEALTPNTLARTIETVSGGGIIVFLLKSMDSLRQLCTLAMDVHARYRTEAHTDVVCRFNERFLLSLAQNPRCIVLDDRWNILPISKKVIHDLGSVQRIEKSEYISHEQAELAKLKVLLTEDDSYFAALVNLCKTLDQAKSLLQFCSALIEVTNPFEKSSKTARKSTLMDELSQFGLSTQSVVSRFVGSVTKRMAQRSVASAVVVMTAGRGRGKSAALGLGLAAAFDAGLPNMCVTAPSPENLFTLMQFVLLGLKALKYEEHVDYTVHRSTVPEHNKAVVKIEVTRRLYRQRLVYLQPWEAAFGAGGGWQPDLFCIDEAAAIPLPTVRQIITGPKLVFMASTVNGYEGTGRSLSVKLIEQLRMECQRADTLAKTETSKEFVGIGRGLKLINKARVLYEVSLKEAIRYANGDPVESWLNSLLCLDCGEKLLSSSADTKTGGIAPAPEVCQLYYVNRDTLFAYHPSTEVFLQRLMALYVASHYKNSPNDLQLLSDAPAHHIFALLAPYEPSSGKVPEILCVIQVCLEGKINRDIVMRGLTRGLKPSGDLIPWTVSQHFCEPNFGELSGARIIRISTHPDYQSLGYGSRALQLLRKYYLGEVPLTISDAVEAGAGSKSSTSHSVTDGNAADVNSDSSSEHMEAEEEEEQVEVIPDSLSEHDVVSPVLMKAKMDTEEHNHCKLLTEKVERRTSSNLPPLLSRLSERKPEKLHYLGVSFGATPKLMRFWKKAGYLPVYLRQTMNELTGEFSCIMLSELRHDGDTGVSFGWLNKFYLDFCTRFVKLLPGPFRSLDASYSLELLVSKSTRSWVGEELTAAEVRSFFSPIDLERLHRYLRSLLDFPMVADQLPQLANLYFLRRFPNVRLNKTQQVILCGLGVQRKSVEQLADELELLLGADGGLQSKGRHHVTATSDDGTFWSSGLFRRGGEGALVKQRLNGIEEGSGDQPVTSGWARRIRGLLFVVIRELVKSLDGTLESAGNEGAQEYQLKSMLRHGETISPLSVSINDGSKMGIIGASDEEDVELGEEFIPVGSEPTATKTTDGCAEQMDAEATARRAEAVRDLLRAEGETQLERYAVRCSAKAWDTAVAGNGAALHVRVGSLGGSKEKYGGGKRKREALGDRTERKRGLRHEHPSIGNESPVPSVTKKHKKDKKHHD